MPSFQPDIPDVVDSQQAVASVNPRPMGISTDQSRAAADATQGKPMFDFAGATNPCIDYQYIDLLLSLRRPRSDGHDEMTFIVMGQAKKLLFKGLHLNVRFGLAIDTSSIVSPSAIVPSSLTTESFQSA